ncbi:regulator of chromosome condensation [Anaeramoeba flamelloides]|uniref:Regulator of chromosome condensation n=1 Tax=Anaeramoeba flamelloides TaxID=1746091 RepID=A0ABQ8XT95_9EUKA|nr:regulator of chromosome condensation [Anaeramoeba flamelloides]
MNSKIWAFGDLPSFFLSHDQNNVQKTKTKKKKKRKTARQLNFNQDIKQISVSQKDLIWTTSSNKYYCASVPNGEHIIAEYNTDPIRQISSGINNHYILTKSGRFFGFVALLRPYNQNTEFTLFKKENFKVVRISCAGGFTLILCSNNRLYGIGSNNYGQLNPNQDTFDIKLDNEYYRNHLINPKLIANGVKLISNGYMASHCLYLTLDNNLYASGNNFFGQLGIGDSVSNLKPTKILGLQNNAIRKISLGFVFSVILINENEIYTCGKEISNGTGKELSMFTKLEINEDIRIKDIYTGSRYCVILTELNKIFVFGSKTSNYFFPSILYYNLHY